MSMLDLYMFDNVYAKMFSQVHSRHIYSCNSSQSLVEQDWFRVFGNNVSLLSLQSQTPSDRHGLLTTC